MAAYWTKQRKQLLEYLAEHRDQQLTAQKIAQDLKREKISLSAVYRNLAVLEEQGYLKRSVREGARESYYQYLAAEECKDQLHLSCLVCGKSIHLGIAETKQLIQNIMDTTGFQLEKTETIFYGTCKACRQQ